MPKEHMGREAATVVQESPLNEGADEKRLAEVLTPRQVARILEISIRTLERYITECRIPYTELPQRGKRRKVRFLRTDLLRWLHSNAVRPTRWKGREG